MNTHPLQAKRFLRRSSRVLLMALSIIFILLALEIGLRLGVGKVFPPRFFEPHAQFGHFHVPGRSGWQRSDEYESYITINSKGLRDVERPYAKPEGVFRVLMLGDSFVEGLQVAQDKTLPVQLEAQLRQRLNSPVEVINAGVSRYGTGNSLLFLEAEGLRYDPDLVIYAFYPNDVTDNLENGVFRLVNGALVRQPERISRSERVRLVLYDYLYIYRFALGLSIQWSYTNDETLIDTEWGKILPIYRAEQQPRETQAWALTARLLERMAAVTPGRLVVVYLPEFYQSQDTVWAQVERSDEVLLRDAPNRMLASILPAGVPYLDLLPSFIAEAQDQVLYYPNDHHFNADGQALAAARVADFLLDARLLPES